ncbi:Synaptobrevin like protein [Aduncisulcus paluster]|uniref:Synaptobrevin like protein n=1 Tax=Aduncisulcus paluster TaxID=2918883 RepID=A0ABQ5KVY0_9EUKA|nr:Synaptobrevin like protein [Aduncisulcus paluster]
MAKTQLVSISFYKRAGSQAHRLAIISQVSGAAKMFKKQAEEICRFGTKVMAERIQPSQRISLNYQDYMIHTSILPNQLVTCLVTTQDYPSRAAHSVISKLQKDFQDYALPVWETATCDIDKNNCGFTKYLKDYMEKYQDAVQADKLSMIERDLEETRIQMVENLNSVLARGEKLEDLIARSGDLSESARRFAIQAHKVNRCCLIL